MPVKPRLVSARGRVRRGRRECGRRAGPCRIERPRLSIVWRNWRSGLTVAGASARQRFSGRDLVLRVVERLLPTTDRAPSERKAGRDAFANGPSRVKNVVSCGAARCSFVQQRGLRVGQLRPGCAIVGAQLVEEGRQPLEAGGDRALARGRDLGGPARRPGSSARRRLVARRARPTTVSESVMKFLIVWSGRRGSSASCRSRAGRGAPCGAASPMSCGRPGEAGAELGDDQPQPVPVGPPQDVADEVRRDRRAVACRG